MASSNPNRHWPSMFKSKPASCNSLHHQWNEHDNIMSPPSCHRTSYASGGDQEERSAEPKPRWNPKPEQIRILEAIFNSGMVNPPRDEIRKIRAQLQEYGQVGDANVFYWFQNRKSRSKHKLRHLHNSTSNNNSSQQTQNLNNNSSPKEITPPPPPQHNKPLMSNIVFSDDVPSDTVPPISSTQPPPPTPQPFFFIPVQHNNVPIPVPVTQGFCFSELSRVVQPEGHQQQINTVGSCTSLLINEIMSPSPSNKNDQDKVMQMQQQPPTTHSIFPPARTTTVTVPSPMFSQIQAMATLPMQMDDGSMSGTEEGTMKSTVFINDVAFEVGVGPVNVREAFGDDVVLIHVSSGQPVLVDEWGITLQPLQHGASYCLVRALS